VSVRACVAALVVAPGSVEAATAYRVTLDDAARTLAVEVCVPEAARTQHFDAPQRAAPRYLLDVSRAGMRAVAREDGTLVAADWRAGECLAYTVDLAAIVAESRRGRGYTFGDDRVAAPRTWLWRPRGRERERDATIAFTLPRGWSLSVPWRALEPTPPRRRFALGARPPAWPALVAFGRFAERDLAAGAGTIRYAALGVAGERATLGRYVAATAADVAATFPRAFALAPQLALVPVGTQRDAVPFGQSYRGGGNGVVLYVDPDRTLDEYFASWTLTHELVHLAHPYLGDDGAWISEGIATYFQNVVRARAGRMSAHAAWRELDAGFGRGRANHSTRTLRETSRAMGRDRLYMRAYWSGTALALAADLAWRTRTEAPTSLEAVLNAWMACCRDADRRVGPDAFLAELDRIAGGAPVFAPLHRAHADASAFPSLEESYATLGIAHRDGALAFAPARLALRRAIMGPTSP